MVTPEQRLAILKDYRRKNVRGDFRYTAESVAEKHGVTLAEVERLRVEAGTPRNGSGTRLWGCPLCGFRALHPLGHAVCMGADELAEAEACQALLVVSHSVDYECEEVA